MKTPTRDSGTNTTVSNTTTSPSKNSSIAKSAIFIGRRLFLAGVVVSAVGCKNFVERAQSPDNQIIKLGEEENEEGTKYVGDYCGIWGMDYQEIEGIGLAVGLDKSGTNPRPSAQRDYLVKELASFDADKIEKLLDSTKTELVWLRGMIPPGIQRGEKFDVEVRVLDNSDATSIENGKIMLSRLRPMKKLGRDVKKGHVLATAKGTVLVDALFETRKDQPNQLHGYILGGGTCQEERKLGLAIGKKTINPKTSLMISQAVNTRFTRTDKSGRRGVAEPKTDRMIELSVPTEYSHNIGRYFQVITNVVFSENNSDRLDRLEQLASDLANPNLAGKAAVRLEAIGKNGIPTLKRALLNDDLEVKFHASQALAYLGEPDGVEHLQYVAENEPAFRWHALTALASLEAVESGIALSELMHVNSAETRYGAFRALLARSPEDPLVYGPRKGDFFLHRIASTAEPMLHFSRAKRPEIVVFGEEQTVGDDFLYVQSGMTVRANGDGTVSVKRYESADGEQKTSCSNRIGELIETLADNGVGYGDLLQILREAKNTGSLNTRLVINAVPKLGRTYVPGQSDEEMPLEQSDKYVAEALPGLFNEGAAEKTETMNPAIKSRQGDSNWSRMKDWFSKKE